MDKILGIFIIIILLAFIIFVFDIPFIFSKERKKENNSFSLSENEKMIEAAIKAKEKEELYKEHQNWNFVKNI